MKVFKTLTTATFYFFAATALVYAATLVNINTADLTTLETLNGIGPSKGQAIIDYRTQHGAFAKIEDIQNVSGIGPSTYANIKDSITVGDTVPQTTQPTQEQATSTAQSTPQAGPLAGNSPPALTAQISSRARVSAGAGSYFEASVFTADNYPLTNARCIWNFGDGAVAEGCRVLHAYSYPGTYSVVLTAAYNYSSAVARAKIEALAAAVSLVAEGDGSLIITNTASSELDISYWALVQGAARFSIPQDTTVLAGEGVRFAPLVLGFSATPDAQLIYPNGTSAAVAKVGSNSPLHGQRVVAAVLKPAAVSQAAQATTSGEVLGVSAQKSSAGQGMLLWTLLGLAGVIVLGSAAAWYLRPHAVTLEETPLSADEFDIA